LQHFTGHYYVLFSDTGSVAVLHTICTIFRRAITAQVWQILKILLPWNFDVVFMISKSNKRFDFQTRVTNLLNCLTLQELLKDASIFISKSKKYLFCCGRYPSSATFASTDWSVLTILTGINRLSAIKSVVVQVTNQTKLPAKALIIETRKAW